MQFSSKRPRAEGVIIQDDGDAHGDQIWPQSGSDWPEMGQIWGFFQIRFSTFWPGRFFLLSLCIREKYE